MKNGWVQACFVGCDRVAANGDAANKIGTSGVAILAKHYGIPFYVLGPTSTIDLNCATGEDIPIEQRDPEEIKEKFYAEPMALPEVKCYNPAFAAHRIPRACTLYLTKSTPAFPSAHQRRNTHEHTTVQRPYFDDGGRI